MLRNAALTILAANLLLALAVLLFIDLAATLCRSASITFPTLVATLFSLYSSYTMFATQDAALLWSLV